MAKEQYKSLFCPAYQRGGDGIVYVEERETAQCHKSVICNSKGRVLSESRDSIG